MTSLLPFFILSGLAACSVVFYLLPVLIGWARHVPDLAVIVVIDVFLGWTAAGWVIALAMALRQADPGRPAIQVVQHFPAPPPAPGQLSGAGWAGPPGAPPPDRAGAPPPLILLPRPPVPGRHPGQPGQP